MSEKHRSWNLRHGLCGLLALLTRYIQLKMKKSQAFKLASGSKAVGRQDVTMAMVAFFNSQSSAVG